MVSVDKLVAFETGELNDDEIIVLFSELVRDGTAWQLQGSYGRMAQRLIEAGHLDRQGTILRYFDESED